MKDKFRCDKCNKKADELVTHWGFIHMFFIEWVCHKCFLKLTGKSFDEFGKDEKAGEVVGEV